MRIKLTGRFLAAAPVALIGLFGCDATGPDEETAATMDATWAGEPWLGGSEARVVDGGVTHLFSWIPVDPGTIPHRRLRVSTQFDGPGTYTIGAAAARIDYLLGGDGLVASYGTTDEHTGTLEIEEVSATHVRGTIAFDAVTTGSYQPAGQQARFQGAFNAPVEQFDALLRQDDP